MGDPTDRKTRPYTTPQVASVDARPLLETLGPVCCCDPQTCAPPAPPEGRPPKRDRA